jgi:nitrogen-specific signal transduction histidine kinase
MILPSAVEPFVSNKHNGMGLAAISRSIVEAHGGKLTAGRNPGRQHLPLYRATRRSNRCQLNEPF